MGSCGTHRYAALRLESLLRLSWRVRFMDGGRFPGVSMNWAKQEEKEGQRQAQAFPATILGVLCPCRCVLGYPIPARANLAFICVIPIAEPRRAVFGGKAADSPVQGPACVCTATGRALIPFPTLLPAPLQCVAGPEHPRDPQTTRGHGSCR